MGPEGTDASLTLSGGATATASRFTASDAGAGNSEIGLVGNGTVLITGTGTSLTVIGTANIVGDLDIQAGTLQVGDMGTTGSIGNPGSVTITASTDGTAGLRYRLGGADALLEGAPGASGWPMSARRRAAPNT